MPYLEYGYEWDGDFDNMAHLPCHPLFLMSKERRKIEECTDDPKIDLTARLAEILANLEVQAKEEEEEEEDEVIAWSDMDFGDEEHSLCGICGEPEPGYFKNGELQEDIICNCCAKIWDFDEDEMRYVKK